MHARGPAGHLQHPAFESRRAHEPRHAMLARGDALSMQGPDDPGAAVGAVRAAMDALDALQEGVVGLRSRARSPGSPSVVIAR